jgi:superfamily I DNA and/or RNA helicase
LRATDANPAITAILTKAAPLVSSIAPGAPLISAAADPLAGAISAICGLNNSYMLVQGPPGSGKTYTSSHAIVELIARGKRVGVSSNSHKAINNLLKAVEEEASRRRITFCGAKKYGTDDQRFGGTSIENVKTNAEIQPHHQLVAGTAWLFARPEFDQAFDHVFIDEAGQVSLPNIVAIGVSARNIVLVGDQMQLAQPLQGVHPGNSGCSALEHLLGELATVPPERGIFLATTRRMHPDVCRFISDAVYEGRLLPDEKNARQALILASGADPVLAPSGIRFVPVIHEGCAQKSEPEATRIREMYASLLRQQWTDEDGATRPIGSRDILVVSPYNIQVNHLKAVLPQGALVGTVDKFQGQEAPVVLISMATSSVDDVPRNLEFLFSRNRLNVAISRARSLAVIFASPKLLEIPCRTIEQMRLVNTFCWAKAYADSLTASSRALSPV